MRRREAAFRSYEVEACVENKAGTAGQPEHVCQLAEAGRGWLRLEAALRLIRRGVLKGGLAEASGRLSSTQPEPRKRQIPEPDPDLDPEEAPNP